MKCSQKAGWFYMPLDIGLVLLWNRPSSPAKCSRGLGTAETTVFERCCCCFVNVVALVELCQCGDLNVTLESRGRLAFAFDCAKTAQNASSWYFMIGATLGHSFTTLELRRMIGCAKLRVLRWEIELFAFKIQIWPDAVQWRKQEKAVHKASSIWPTAR